MQKKQGVWTWTNNTCIWWLDTYGRLHDTVEIINDTGFIDEIPISVDTDCIGVRPAIWMNRK
jgi:hypothetical protein